MSITLDLHFRPRGNQTDLIWNLDGEQEVSSIVHPFGPDTPLVLAMLDHIQNPHPDAATSYLVTASTHERLKALGFSDGTQLLPHVQRRVGHALYATLAGDAAGQHMLEHAEIVTRQNGDGLDLNLRFPADAASWAALPWELLTKPTEELPLLLELGGRSSCTRYLTSHHDRTIVAASTQPLTILAVTPQAQIDRAWRENQRAILKAALPTEGIRLIMPEPPLTMTVLNNLLREYQPQVLSFYGHGVVRDGEGHLLLDTAGGGEDYVSGHQLASLFHTGGLRAALLFSCYSSATDGTSFRDVATALSTAGIPAVVAMHLRLRVRAATRLQAVICESLARGLSVQEAVAWARLALYTEEQDCMSWSVPTLTIAQPKPTPIYLVAHPASSTQIISIGGQQALQGGMRRTARTWKTIATGTAGAVTLGMLLAGGLSPLIVGGISMKTLLPLITSLGGNALASWLDTWARNAKDRLLTGDQEETMASLAHDLEAAFTQQPDLANDMAALLEKTDGIAISIQALREKSDDQADVIGDIRQQIASQHQVISALRDDMRRTNLIQGRLHRVVMTQLDQSTETILAEIKAATIHLDANDQQILALLRSLHAEFQVIMQHSAHQPSTKAQKRNSISESTISGPVTQIDQSINLKGARIRRMRDIVQGNKYTTTSDEEADC